MNKNLLKLLVILLTASILSGCSLLADPISDDGRIVFSKDNRIQLGDNVDTTLFVQEVDGVAVTDEMRNEELHEIDIGSIKVICPEFRASRTGAYDLKYSINDIEFSYKVKVGDFSSPIVEVKDKYLYVNEIFKIDNVEYTVTDNDSNIDVSLKGKYDMKVAGVYELQIVAKDSSGNKGSENFKLHVLESPTLKVDRNNISIEKGSKTTVTAMASGIDKTVVWSTSNPSVAIVDKGVITATGPGKATITAKANGLSVDVSVTVTAPKNSQTRPSSGSGNGGNTTTNKNTSRNASSYNKFFSGNSIDSYNRAVDYAESTYRSKGLKGYEVMPTGEGFSVTFR